MKYNVQMANGDSKLSTLTDPRYEFTGSSYLGVLFANRPSMLKDLKLSYASLEPLKRSAGSARRGREISNLSTADHEVLKLAYYQNGKFMLPTFSNKKVIMTINLPAVTKTMMKDGIKVVENQDGTFKVDFSDTKMLELYYNHVIKPEVDRAVNEKDGQLYFHSGLSKHLYDELSLIHI